MNNDKEARCMALYAHQVKSDGIVYRDLEWETIPILLLA